MAECLPADFGGPVDRPFEAFPESDVQASIVDRFEAIAKRFPDRLAIQDQANSFTYRELGALVAADWNEARDERRNLHARKSRR